MTAIWRRTPTLLATLAIIASAFATLSAQEPAHEPAEQAAPDKPAKAEASKHKYVRLVRDDHGDPAALETAIVHFVPAGGDRAGLSVDLVGAVHVGDKAYYERLNKKFESYDALLFELVADNGVVPKPGQPRGGAISAIQMTMKDMLELDFQLDGIDYTKKNFVHADMSPDEMAKSMRKKGESIWTMMARMMAVGMAQGGKSEMSDFDLITALLDNNRALHLKRLMAAQFVDMDGMLAALDGPKGSTLIAERNKAALKVLKDEIKGGKKKIGIFYGAGHLADMEKRLVSDFGLKRADEHWVEAWNLRLPGDKDAAKKPAAGGGDKAGKTDKQPAAK